MALLTLFAVLTLALAPTGQATLGVGAGTYFLKGTQTPKDSTSDQQVIDQQTEWIVAATGAPPPQPLTVVDYPAQMWPFSDHPSSDLTLEESVAAGIAALPSPRDIAPGTLFWGGSQGAIVSSLYKREFNQAWAGDPQNAPAVTFVLTRNEMRPNGGVLSRFLSGRIPALGVPFYGPTPTQTAGAPPGQITTYGIVPQYSLLTDFPTNPLFVLSDMNVVMYELAALVKKPAFGVQDAVLQGDYGDTRYYLTPTYPVPLLIPVSLVPKIGPSVADMLDPAFRVLVEAGYDRTISPGQPTPADFRYFPKPIALSRNLLLAMRTGIDNGLQDIIEIRPLETTARRHGSGRVRHQWTAGHHAERDGTRWRRAPRLRRRP